MLCAPHLGTKQQEIVVSRGKILELLRPDANTGKVHTLLTMEVFGIVRSLMAFRLTGGTKGGYQEGRNWMVGIEEGVM